MFHMVLHVTPLGRVEGFRDLVLILRHLSLLKGWDVKHNLSNLQLATLKIRWNHAKMNTPLFRNREDCVDIKSVTEILAADAARKGYGYVHISNGQAKPPVEGTWTTDELKKWTCKKSIKIILMELHAAVDALLIFFTDFPECSKLLLAVDSSGVAFCLRKGFSSLDEAQTMIDRVMHLLHRVEVIQVTTADSCADCPSRRSYEDFDFRVARTILVCNEQIRGVKIGVAAPRRGAKKQTDTTGENDDLETFEDEIGVDWTEDNAAEEHDEQQPVPSDSLFGESKYLFS